MNRIVIALSSLVFGAALLASTGCGSSSTGGTGGGGTTTTTTSGSSSFTCCINGTNYDCPSQSDDDACGNGDPSGCEETGTNPSGTCS